MQLPGLSPELRCTCAVPGLPPGPEQAACTAPGPQGAELAALWEETVLATRGAPGHPTGRSQLSPSTPHASVPWSLGLGWRRSPRAGTGCTQGAARHRCRSRGQPRVLTPPCRQVLESFKIMDYSLLLGVHNIDQQERQRQAEGAQSTADEKRPLGQKALYSTAMESIQGGAARGEAIETDDT